MLIEMGTTYWKTNGTTETFEQLISTLESFGLVKINQRTLGTEMEFKRVCDWETKGGLKFSTIWYVNTCYIRWGEWETDLAEIYFDKIIGSYLPYADHLTIDFTYKDNTMFRLALLKEKTDDK